MLKLTVLLTSITLASAASAQELAGPSSVEVEDGRQFAKLILSTQPATQIKINASQIDSLIVLLGQARTQMLPMQPSEFSQRATAYIDPAWAHQKVPDGSSILAIRDLRYGWLHYKIGPEPARQLAESILKASAPPPIPIPSR